MFFAQNVAQQISPHPPFKVLRKSLRLFYLFLVLLMGNVRKVSEISVRRKCQGPQETMKFKAQSW